MAARARARTDARAAVAAALTRERAELEALVRRRFPAVDAGDAVQRAAVRALERAGHLRDAAKVEPWVRRIVVTCALDLLRERAQREVPTAEVPEPAVVAQGESCACSVTLLASLRPAYADILRRVDLDGGTLDEVAEALAIDKGNAAVHLHRARRALRGKLRAHCGVETARECLTCACAERGCCPRD